MQTSGFDVIFEEVARSNLHENISASFSKKEKGLEDLEDLFYNSR